MNETEIVKLYTKQNQSTYQIAKAYNTYPNKIRRILVKHGVNIKSKSEAQKNALKSGAAKIPTEGRNRSPEERLSIGKAMKKHWSTMSDEERNRRSELSRRQWEQMSAQEQEDMRKAAHEAMREAGKNGSKFERYLYEELVKAGFNVEFHVKDFLAHKNLEIDMFIPSLKAIIEVDGPSHFLPIWGEERLQKQIHSDTHKKGLILSKSEYVIIRLKTSSDYVCYSDSIRGRDLIIDLLNQIKQQVPDQRLIEIEL